MDTRRRFLGNKLEIFPTEFNADNYLTIEALEDGLYASLSINDCEYCVNGSNNWIALPAGTNTSTINKGSTLLFRGALIPTSSNGIGTFTVNKQFNLKGNCMSMLYGNYAAYTQSIGSADAFNYLFNKCSTLLSVSNTFLPATNLADSCYYNMFRGCTSLTNAPALPATTLAKWCYAYMFEGCTSLTTAPELPATTLAYRCYYSMFMDCSSLTTAPELPATTLADSCYYRMFFRCTRLTTTPILPATKHASDCYNSMLEGTSLLPDCSNIRFSDPNDIASGVCKGLFTGTKVTDSDLFNILPVNSNGKYYLPVTSLADSCYAYMFEGCTSLTTAPELPATKLASECYHTMFMDCTSLTNAPALPATTLANYCYYHMFYNCKSLTTAPELLATTLVPYCYYNMFRYCSNLNYIKMTARDISANHCLDSWVTSVASKGTFVKGLGVSIPFGISGIPEGWVVNTDYNPTTCTSLSITAQDVTGNATHTTISWTAVVSATDEYGNVLNNITLTGTSVSDTFPQNTTASSKTVTVSYTYLGKTATTTITQGPWVNPTFDVNLNNQWRLSTTVSNPDSNSLVGVYESFSNYNVASSEAKMTITLTGYTEFSLLIRSDADSSYDYVMVSQLDCDINRSTSYSNTNLVKAYTRGNQRSGQELIDYTGVHFTRLDGGTHVITIIYRKDSSTDAGTDAGYVIIDPTCSYVHPDNYMTIEALNDGTIVTWNIPASTYGGKMYYCLESEFIWTALNPGAGTRSVDKGQKLLFKGIPPSNYVIHVDGIGQFSVNKSFNLSGNCMSLLACDFAKSATSFSPYVLGSSSSDDLGFQINTFANLFKNCTTLVSVSQNFLPATEVVPGCYYQMFEGCTSLVNTPILPALTLYGTSYSSMFKGCTSLTSASPIYATTMKPYTISEEAHGSPIGHCRSMFEGCSNLVTLPKIRAISVQDGCFRDMVVNCSKLNYIEFDVFSADMIDACNVRYSGEEGYLNLNNRWVRGCASTGTFKVNNYSSMSSSNKTTFKNYIIPTSWSCNF